MKSKRIGIQLSDHMDSDVWDLKVEVEKDENGKILQGLVIGDILFQNQATILAAYPGELKFEPTLGVGLKKELLGEDLLKSRHKIREDFPKDGLRIRDLDLYDVNKVNITASYES